MVMAWRSGIVGWSKALISFPSSELGSGDRRSEIGSDELTMLLRGIDLSTVRRRKRYSLAS
jgi:hypothetical protein